tara:strand:+ start:36593 stop:37783 length:1191 start_codon:yes stop_codon:yes gene_type:complete
MILTARKSTYLFILLLICNPLVSCTQESKSTLQIKTGADRTELYLKKLKGKRVGVVANQTSVISTKNGYTHLVDSLLSRKINIKKVFAPEHGFRGKADAGEIIKDSLDSKTGLPIVSIYAKNKKPTAAQLEGIDVILFDIQDVGARFYTYISTLHYVMEAAAESKIPVIVLDRPNPNGHYIDGPILEMEYKSFVGMHPIPVIYGMTIGEYGKMINGEKWLEKGIQSKLTVIPLKNYTHESEYSLPIKPSPNLPNDKSINLYPSLCFFEGTNVNAGRGTEKQFQIYGSPYLNHKSKFTYTPSPNEGAKYPKHAHMICYGEDLSDAEKLSSINLSWLLQARLENSTKNFFNDYFTTLAGTKKLQKKIEEGLSEEEIKASWKEGLESFKKVRAKYLIYE